MNAYFYWYNSIWYGLIHGICYTVSILIQKISANFLLCSAIQRNEFAKSSMSFQNS